MSYDLGDGVEIKFFDDKPPMRFEGKLDDRWWWRALWWKESWMFYVATQEDHLNDMRKCVYVEHGHIGERIRPEVGTKRLVEAVKDLVRSRVAKFRVDKGPREWLPVKKDA